MDASHLNTRDRLLRSAERLMARDGISEVSVRAITEDAGANVAAINYHFGGKDELVQALLTAKFELLDVTVNDMLSRLAETWSKENASLKLDDVVRVYLAALVKLGVDSRRNALDPFIPLIQRASIEREVALRNAQNLQNEGISKLVSMIAESSGRPVTMGPAFYEMLGLMYSGGVAMMHAMVSAGDEKSRETLREALEAFVLSGVRSFIEKAYGD